MPLNEENAQAVKELDELIRPVAEHFRAAGQRMLEHNALGLVVEYERRLLEKQYEEQRAAAQ